MEATEKRKVCPECGSTQVRAKTGRNSNAPREHAEDYCCNHCGAHFDDPSVGAGARSGPTIGLAADLAARGDGGES